MNTILITLLLLTDVIKYIVILDIILSWLTLFWLKSRPKFIADIIDPMYNFIKKIIPTTFWPMDFTPIIILIILIFLKWLVYSIDPAVWEYYLNIKIF